MEPAKLAAIPFPPHTPPWAAHYLPPKPRPTSSLTIFNKITTKKLREAQSQEYSSHRHTQYYKQFRSSIDTKWRNADLKNYEHSRTILRLRSGHSNLFMHDRLSEESNCPCGPPLTAEHALLECKLTPELEQRRKELFKSLKEFISFKDKPSLQQLLTAPKCSLSLQRKHLKLVAQFAQKLPFPP